jgi:biopolymer transport protein ExbB
MLTTKLLAVTNLGAEWVLWLLVLLSVASVAVMIERALFFSSRSLAGIDALADQVLAGDLDAIRAALQGKEGMEAAVLRAALDHAAKGPDAVAEVVSAQLERSRLDYERRLAFLGTLGNNAPFIGLFGTVLGVIRAFDDLASNPGAAGAGTVMAGISEALVATAVGLFVALPAVVAYNLFQRQLRQSAQRASVLGHAVVALLRAAPAPTAR